MILVSYEKISQIERDRIIKKHNENRLLDKITRNVKKYSDNDVYLAVKLAYAACDENTPVSEYNNILFLELEKILEIPEIENKFVKCVEKWHNLESNEKRKWVKKANKQKLTGFNLFISECQLKRD